MKNDFFKSGCRKKMRIFVKTLPGRTITVDTSDLIGDSKCLTTLMVKKRISEMRDIHIEEQTLIFAGKILDDNENIYTIMREEGNVFLRIK